MSKSFVDKRKKEDWFDRKLKKLKKDREENFKKWEEQNKKWNEDWKKINRTLDNTERLNKMHYQSICALGARWGLHSGSAFRNGLKGILEDMFNVEVKNYREYDSEGEVFGWPEEIELDIIIKNGLLIICEIKSSISKPEMYTFYKKALFYEKMHNRKASKLMVISPMVDKGAMKVAKDFNISVYSYADKVDKDLLKE